MTGWAFFWFIVVLLICAAVLIIERKGILAPVRVIPTERIVHVRWYDYPLLLALPLLLAFWELVFNTVVGVFSFWWFWLPWIIAVCLALASIIPRRSFFMMVYWIVTLLLFVTSIRIVYYVESWPFDGDDPPGLGQMTKEADICIDELIEYDKRIKAERVAQEELEAMEGKGENEYQTANTRATEAGKAVTEQLDRLKSDEFKHCIPPKPRASFGTAFAAEMTILFESDSTPVDSEFVYDWYPLGDRDRSVVLDDHDGEATYTYLETGQYFPILKVTDIYGQSDETGPEDVQVRIASPSRGNTVPTEIPTEEPDEEVACPGSWPMQSGSYGNNRYFSDGFAPIKSADNRSEANRAARDWLNAVKSDPVLLKGIYRIITADSDNLSSFSSGGCASDAAVDAAERLVEIFNPSGVRPDTAPKGVYNSGVDDQRIVRSSKAELSGDRTAIYVYPPSGWGFYILARSGAIVAPWLDERPIHVGNTDE